MPGPTPDPLSPDPVTVIVAPEVAQALSAGGAVVALESTLLAHGLPRPGNVDVARRIEDTVRGRGAVPATIAVLDGVVHVGLDGDTLQRVCTDPDLAKLGIRDLPVALALGSSGATTVSSTALLARRAGIDVFATGGLGGVHRGAGYDESADLRALAEISLVVVCAGVKSILDVQATLERLESSSVTVLGFRTHRFPGFYLSDSGAGLDWRVETAGEVAAVFGSRRALGAGAVVLANPLPEAEQVEPALHDRVLAAALASARDAGVTGKAVTPHLLAAFHETSGGESLRANIAIILRNAALAADVAVALAGR